MHCRVRLLRLETVDAEFESLGTAWLNDAERRQFDATSAVRRRRQFLVGHWLARRMAAEAQGGAPEDWSFDVEVDGRRRLTHTRRLACWTSISHWTDWVGCALADAPVGLDVQGPDRPRDLASLAQEVLSPAECAEIEALQGEAQSRAFYRFWTLKEARAKLEGVGLRPDLARGYEVQPGEIAAADAFTWRANEKSIALCIATSSTPIRLEVSPDLGAARAWRFVPVRAATG